MEGIFRETETEICLMIPWKNTAVSAGRWDKETYTGTITHFYGGCSKLYHTITGWKKGLKVYGYTWKGEKGNE